MNATHDEIFHIVCKHCGVAYIGSDAGKEHIQNYDLSRETFQNLNMRLAHMHGASRVWERPGQIENQLEDARKKLMAAIEAVERLDNYAKVLARREALKERDAQFERRIVEISNSGADPASQEAAFSEAIGAFPPVTPEEYADRAAIAQIRTLSEALVRPIERAIPMVQEGRGRPRNLRAYAVAEHAYLIFEELTGQKPTYWNAKETTPFGRLVEFLFDAYGIQSTVRKPIEAAMHKFDNAA